MLARRNGAGTGRQTAGWIGDAIYGVNDGLGAIFGIVSGVSGATQGTSKYVLLAGIAGMIASALSMGSGAYLAAKSEREIYEAEVARERDAIEMNGPEARELLSLYYQVKGLPEDDADQVVEHIAQDKDQLLRALASERLKSSEEALRDPMTSAFSGAISTAVGAFIPIIPFFFLNGYPAIIASAVISLVAHFAVGAAKSLITIRSWWASGTEMTLVGAVEGLVTYVIGIGLGRVARKAYCAGDSTRLLRLPITVVKAEAARVLRLPRLHLPEWKTVSVAGLKSEGLAFGMSVKVCGLRSTSGNHELCTCTMMRCPLRKV